VIPRLSARREEIHGGFETGRIVQLPAVIKTTSGKPEVFPKTLPPQLGQNPRLKLLPLSAGLS
jgi:hypothetical protein